MFPPLEEYASLGGIVYEKAMENLSVLDSAGGGNRIVGSIPEQRWNDTVSGNGDKAVFHAASDRLSGRLAFPVCPHGNRRCQGLAVSSQRNTTDRHQPFYRPADYQFLLASVVLERKSIWPVCVLAYPAVGFDPLDDPVVSAGRQNRRPAANSLLGLGHFRACAECRRMAA